jgi:hypothetical protein
MLRSTLGPTKCGRDDAGLSSMNYRQIWNHWSIGLTAIAALAWTTAPVAGPSATADQKVLSALDKEYQSAVEKNDASTMARILADDYVLVDGIGKSYTKKDLIDDAKSARRITCTSRTRSRRCGSGAILPW